MLVDVNVGRTIRSLDRRPGADHARARLSIKVVPGDIHLAVVDHHGGIACVK